MPFTRPTISELRAQVASDINGALPGADAQLRFSALKAVGKAQADLSHAHYGYLDWIARQAVPFTATGEYLEGWAALKNVFRKAATSWIGTISFSGVNGTVVPAGSVITRGDGAGYVSLTDTAVSGGVAIVSAASTLPGSAGNTDSATAMILDQAITGIQSTGAVASTATSGTDIESDDDLRGRMLQAYQNPPQGGAVSDYETWALAVPGVTRAWIKRNGAGVGTVVVYAMLDAVQAAHDGFPQGVDGVASLEDRDAPATGDQLTVANAIFPLQPATALVYAVSPMPQPINFTISGLASASTATKALVAAALRGVFLLQAKPGGVVNLSFCEAAVAAIAKTSGFIIAAPSTNIASDPGHLATLGAITYV